MLTRNVEIYVINNKDINAKYLKINEWTYNLLPGNNESLG